MSKAHREYFNRQASEWAEKMGADPEVEQTLTRFGILEGDRILDMGAGTGRVSTFLADLAGESGMVIAADIADEMLRAGSRGLTVQPVYWVCTDASSSAFRETVFDKAICFSSFPHFKDPAGTLIELRRILRPGGRLLILHMHSSSELNAFHASLEGVVSDDVLPSADKLARMLRDAGFIPQTLIDEPGLYYAESVKPEHRR